MESNQINITMFQILSQTINSIYNPIEEVPTIVIDESNEDEGLHITVDESIEDKALHMSIDESNEDREIDQTFENEYKHVVIDETDLDEDEDEVTRMVVDEIDESNEDSEIDLTFEHGYEHVIIDETDIDEVSCIVIDETDQEMEAVAQSESNSGTKRCPELKYIELSNKLQEIVSEIETLELVPCDLVNGITTEFDNCVMLRVKALEVS